MRTDSFLLNQQLLKKYLKYKNKYIQLQKKNNI